MAISIYSGITANKSGGLSLPGDVTLAPAASGPSFLPTTSASKAAVHAATLAVQGYTGPLYTLLRASDSATLDVYPLATGKPDYAAIDSWIGASSATYSVWHDQSGNGYHATQTTAAKRPTHTALNARNGIRPISLSSLITDTTNPKCMVQPAITGLNRQNFGYHMVTHQRLTAGNSQRGLSSFTDGVNPDLHVTIHNGAIGGLFASLSYQAGSYVFNNNGRLRSIMQCIGLSSSASNEKIYKDGAITSFTARTSAAIAQGGLIGSSIISNNYTLEDRFSFVVFGSAPSDADIAAMDAWAASAYGVTNSATKRLVYSGSSLNEGWCSTLNQDPLYQMQLDSTWDSYNMGIGGRSLTTEYGDRTTTFSLYDGTKSKNVLTIDAPSNDIEGQTFANQAAAEAYADTLYTTVTLPYVAAAKAVGFRVVVPTEIARGSQTIANFKQYALLRYNSNVTTGAVANGYTASDRYGDSRLQNAANTTYFFGDQVHLINAGYAVMASIDKAAILAA